MTTPLKALIQERLRAKIVRQGDDEGMGPDGYTGAFPASLSATTPLIDPSEYMVPPPFIESAAETRSYSNNHEDDRYPGDCDGNQYASELKYDRRRPHQDEEDGDYRQYDEYSGRSSRSAAATRQPSPLKVKRSKRSWRTDEEDRQFGMDRQPSNQQEEPPMYSVKRARVLEKPRPRYRNEDGYASVSPTRRKNYDLSGAYQRYREISSKREQTRMPEPHSSQHESPVTSWSEPKRREFTRSHRYYVEEYDAPADSSDRKRRWKTTERTAASTHHAQDNYNPKEDSVPLVVHQHRRLGDVHPVSHVAPAHPVVVSPSSNNTKRRSFSPVASRMYSNQFEYYDRIDTSSDRLVFPAAMHIPSVPRSPTVHFHRSPDSGDNLPSEHLARFRAYDNVLSPGSCQAAKDFVEKRQKRSTQGTPRTMATHRWLQSMMEARRSNSSVASAQDPPATSEDNSSARCAYYPAAMVEPPSTNNDHFYTDNATHHKATDQPATPPRDQPRASQQPPLAFYSPRMYSSGSFFEAEI